MKNVVVTFKSDVHALRTHTAASCSVGLWAVVSLLVLLASSTTWAGAPILISPVGNPAALLQVNAYGGAQHGTQLRVVYDCPPGNTDCTWTLLPNGMIVSDTNPTLAWNAYGGAIHGADITLVNNCQPTNTDCTWTIRPNGLIVSNTNPQLAVNAYGGAQEGASLKLVNNCAPELDGCKWVTLAWRGAPIQISSVNDPSVMLQIKTDGRADHGATLNVVSDCPPGNTDCTWTLLPNGMIVSNTNPSLVWNAYGGAREGAEITLVNNCQPSLTDCTWTVRPDGLIVSNTNPQLAVKADGGVSHGAPLKLAPNCTPRLDGCRWVTLPSLGALAGEWVLNHDGYWSTLTIIPDPSNTEKFTGLIHVTSRRAPDTRVIKGTVTSGAQKVPITAGAKVEFWRTLLDGSVQRFDGLLMYRTDSNVIGLTQMAGTFSRLKDGAFVEPAGWFACKREYCNPWVIANPSR